MEKIKQEITLTKTYYYKNEKITHNLLLGM